MSWEIDLIHCTFDVEHPFMDAQHSLCGILKCHIQEWKRLSSAWYLISRIAAENDQFYSDSNVEITEIDSCITSLLKAKEQILGIMECSEETISTWENNDTMLPENKIVSLQDYDIVDVNTQHDINRLITFIDDVASIMRYYPQDKRSYYQFHCADW